jgi:hypothetical protein
MLGTLMRLPLRLIPDGMVATYERRVQHQLAHVLRPGDVAYDIGANAGFFMLLMSRLVGPSGHVHTFEPLPLNIARLRRHLWINNIANVTAAKFCSYAHSGSMSSSCSPVMDPKGRSGLIRRWIPLPLASGRTRRARLPDPFDFRRKCWRTGLHRGPSRHISDRRQRYFLLRPLDEAKSGRRA